jgi:hypothetical protein
MFFSPLDALLFQRNHILDINHVSRGQVRVHLSHELALRNNIRDFLLIAESTIIK